MEKKILVVDDSAEVLVFLEEAFTINGYTVVSAETAEEALERQPKEKCLVMFLDLNLPGMNGLELCRKIKAEFPLAICHAITAHTDLFQLADCREAGFEDFFPKPIDIQILNKAAQEAFEKVERWMKQCLS